MSCSTGFIPFWIYISTKNIHFGNGNYDITRDRLPEREKWVKLWNEKRRNKDGIFFHKLMRIIPYVKEEYIKLYAFYWLINPHFTIFDIFNDSFEQYYNMKSELGDIKTVIGNDFIKIVKFSLKKNLKLKDIFFSNKIYPPCFTFYDKGIISVHSLLVFNSLFHFMKKFNVEKLNIVEKERIKKYEKIFDKYQPIVYDELLFDWKNYLTRLIK